MNSLPHSSNPNPSGPTGNEYPQRSSGNNSTNNYSRIQEGYQRRARKENTTQKWGQIFIILTGIILIVAYRLAQRVAGSIERTWMVRLFGIFAIIVILDIFALIQLFIIRRWNKNINENKLSLSQIHYKLLGQVNLIRITQFIIVIFCIIFIRFHFLLEFPVRSSDFPGLLLIYRIIRFIALMIVISYMIVQIIQFVQWGKRKTNLKKVERQIFLDLPDLEGLQHLVDLNEANNVGSNIRMDKKADQNENQDSSNTYIR